MHITYSIIHAQKLLKFYLKHNSFKHYVIYICFVFFNYENVIIKISYDDIMQLIMNAVDANAFKKETAFLKNYRLFK